MTLSTENETGDNKGEQCEGFQKTRCLLRFTTATYSNQVHNRNYNYYRNTKNYSTTPQVRCKKSGGVLTEYNADKGKSQSVVKPIAPANEETAITSESALGININPPAFEPSWPVRLDSLRRAGNKVRQATTPG
jgi:hypothetical protein